MGVTANVNKEGKVYSVKLFDKANSEGNDAAMREFKNLKTLRHEKMVSLVDAFGLTDSLCSSSAPSHPLTSSPTSPSVLSTPRMTCVRFLGRSWTPWSTSTGEARSTSTSSPPTSSSALEGHSEGPSRSS